MTARSLFTSAARCSIVASKLREPASSSPSRTTLNASTGCWPWRRSGRPSRRGMRRSVPCRRTPIARRCGRSDRRRPLAARASTGWSPRYAAGTVRRAARPLLRIGGLAVVVEIEDHRAARVGGVALARTRSASPWFPSATPRSRAARTSTSAGPRSSRCRRGWRRHWAATAAAISSVEDRRPRSSRAIRARASTSGDGAR